MVVDRQTDAFKIHVQETEYKALAGYRALKEFKPYETGSQQMGWTLENQTRKRWCFPEDKMIHFREE